MGSIADRTAQSRALSGGWAGRCAAGSSRLSSCAHPDTLAIHHAARVKFSFELHDSKGTGAYGLDGVMIDAPMYKQALNTLALATAAGLEIPVVTEKDIA